MSAIPLKKHWRSTDAWRGVYDYEHSVADGCFLAMNDYHNKSETERIKTIKAILRKNKIPCKVATAQTSNVFSTGYDIVVAPNNVSRAKKLLKEVV
jgi:hypothetical protein